ncbi:MAG: AMP-binding protein, partial [Gammaproteobacteria bacterium]
ILLAYPLFHVSGLHASFLSALRGGRRIVMMYKWDAERALAYIQSERVTSFSGSPSMVLELLEHPRFADYDTTSLNGLGAGGSATPAKATKLMFERVRNPMPGTGWA